MIVVVLCSAKSPASIAACNALPCTTVRISALTVSSGRLAR